MITYMKLRNYAGSGKWDPQRVLQNMAKSLDKSEDTGQVQLRIIDKKVSVCGALKLTKKGAEVSADIVDNPDLEIITDDQTARAIVKGTRSPVQAFLEGKMRVRGDRELGKRILQALGSGKGAVDIQ